MCFYSLKKHKKRGKFFYIMKFACIKLSLIKKTALFLSVIVTSCLLLTFTSGAYVFYGNSSRKLPVYYVKTEEKKLALTFDCAWGVDYTDQLLSILQEENVTATFFMVKFWVEKYPEYVKKICDAGHEIGTHSSTHPYMSKLSAQAQKKELENSVESIKKITNGSVNCFRPPYGDYNDTLIDTATSLNLFTIQWDVDSLDWKNLSATEIEGRVLSKAKNGSIILFHNQGLNTSKALKNIIKNLKEKGYAFCSVYDLIYKDNFRMGADGAQIKTI